MKYLATATLLATTASATLAGEIRLDAPMRGESLHTAQADMAVYWTQQETGYEVVATYVAPAQGTEPQRLVMLLADGDTTAFSLPGLPSTQYNFTRHGSVVRVWSAPTWAQVASN